MIKYPYEIIENINNLSDNDFSKGLNSEYTIAFLLYYSKRLNPNYQKIVIEKTFNLFLKFNKNNGYGIPYSLSHYTKKTQKLIMNNIGFLQTNFGCTKGCYFCGCDALFSSSPICIPFNQLKYLIKKFSKDITKNYTYLYRASDPLDYYYRNKTYKHILNLYQKYIKKDPYTSSAINKNNFFLYKQISKKITRVSYLGSDKTIYNNIKNQINDNSYEGYSLKNIWYNGLRGYKHQKYDNGILCLNGTLLTPFFAYNLVNIGKCNNFFPQGLLSYPILKINNEEIQKGDNLIDHLTSKIVMYDYVDHRSQRGKFDKFVVFLRDFKNIYFLVCSKSDINNGIIKVINVLKVNPQEYKTLCFSKGGQNILFKLESNG